MGRERGGEVGIISEFIYVVLEVYVICGIRRQLLIRWVVEIRMIRRKRWFMRGGLGLRGQFIGLIDRRRKGCEMGSSEGSKMNSRRGRYDYGHEFVYSSRDLSNLHKTEVNLSP